MMIGGINLQFPVMGGKNGIVLPTLYKTIWWVPRIGVPPNHPFLDRIFHEINHPATGVPPFMEIPR